MQVSKMMHAQQQHESQHERSHPAPIPMYTQNPYAALAAAGNNNASAPSYHAVVVASNNVAAGGGGMYPDIGDYMGLDVANLPAGVVAIQSSVVSAGGFEYWI